MASRPANRESAPGLPRWVKVFGVIAAIVVVALFAIQHLIFGGMGHH